MLAKATRPVKGARAIVYCMICARAFPDYSSRPTRTASGASATASTTASVMINIGCAMDDEMRNDHGHCGRDYREQVLCDVKLVKP